jgi:hypothetical protein
MMPGYSDDDGKALIADILRLFVGHGRRITWELLAAATGDDVRKLRSYVEAPYPAMPFPVFQRVFRALPPECFAQVAQHMGFSAGPLVTDDDATVRRGLAQASRLVADGNEFLEDGELSPKERADLRRRAADMLPTIAAIAGGGTTH